MLCRKTSLTDFFFIDFHDERSERSCCVRQIMCAEKYKYYKFRLYIGFDRGKKIINV